MTPLPAETLERIERIAGFHFKQWRIRQGNKSLLSAFKEALTQLAEEERREMETAKPLSEWSEDDGFVLWWSFPVVEPPYVGTPLCTDFPTGVTHFTPFETPNDPS